MYRMLMKNNDRANNIINKNGGHYYYDGNNMLIEAEERGAFAVNVGLKEAEGDLQQIMSVESDFIGTREMTYTAEETDLALDYGAISIGVDLEDWHQVGSVVIDPEAASWRIEPRQLEVYVSSSNMNGSYEEITDYLYLEEEGKIIIRMRRPVEARHLKVHCTFDERDFDNNYVDLATVRNTAGSLVTVHYLTHERGEEYTYDAKGNRQAKTIDHDGTITDVTYTYYPNSDRIKSDGTYGYRYDANGNMTGKGTSYTDNGNDIEYGTTEGEVWTYTYDLFNRLIEVKKSESGTDNLETIATYVYDHRGLRIQRTGKDGEVTHYTYSPAGKVLSEEDDGEVTDYIYLGNKLLAKKTGGETFWYLTDHLGSTIMMTDENGDVSWNEGYTAFGEKAGETGFDLDESGRYTGKDYDEDTGLYYFNARWYDASLGRFTTEDPIRDGANWWVYCSNNPLKYVDPTGLSPKNLNETQRKIYMEYVAGLTPQGTMYEHNCADVAAAIYSSAMFLSTGEWRAHQNLTHDGEKIDSVTEIQSKDFFPVNSNNITFYKDKSFNSKEVEVGSVAVWESDDKSSWVGHVATVVGVERDDDGNVLSIDIIQGHTDIEKATEKVTITSQKDLDSYLGTFHGWGEIGENSTGESNVETETPEE